MAMTSVVKDELSRVAVIKPCCRKAEVSTLLRFAGTRLSSSFTTPVIAIGVIPPICAE